MIVYMFDCESFAVPTFPLYLSRNSRCTNPRGSAGKSPISAIFASNSRIIRSRTSDSGGAAFFPFDSSSFYKLNSSIGSLSQSESSHS